MHGQVQIYNLSLTLKFAQPCNVIPDCISLVVSLSRGGIVSITTVNHNI